MPSGRTRQFDAETVRRELAGRLGSLDRLGGEGPAPILVAFAILLEHAEIAGAQGRPLKIAVLYSEQDKSILKG